jgi:NADH-quinone oxidoreductase subunit A
METGLLAVLIFVAIIAGFIFVVLWVGKFLRPPVEHTPLKDSPYECAEEPVKDAWFNYNPRFYLIALIFVIFDVEIALVFPVTAVFRDWVELGRGLTAFLEISLFVLVLLAALVYAVLRKDVRWIKDLRRW